MGLSVREVVAVLDLLGVGRSHSAVCRCESTAFIRSGGAVSPALVGGHAGLDTTTTMMPNQAPNNRTPVNEMITRQCRKSKNV